MSKVFKRKTANGLSKFYYYRVYGGTKEKLCCTFETELKAARAKANGHTSAVGGGFNVDELFKALVLRLERMPQEDRDKRRIDFGNRLLRLQAETLPFAEAWEKWMAMPNKSRHGNPSANTLTGYAAIWKRLEKWATAATLVNLHEMTRKHGEDYMAHLWASGITERTYGAHLKFLRSMFKTLRLQAGIIENPFAELTIPELQTQSREAFTPEELKTICAKASGDWRYLVGIGIYTGLRLTDAVHLKWGDVSDRIRVVPQKTKRRKKAVEIMLHPALLALLDELRRERGGKPSGYLFPDMVAAYAKARAYPSAAFVDFLRDECNIQTTATASDGHRRRMAAAKGFHSLRHSFVSMCAMSGVPQATTQKLVGHSSPAMTQIYSHTSDDEQRKAISLLPSGFFGAAG